MPFAIREISGGAAPFLFGAVCCGPGWQAGAWLPGCDPGDPAPRRARVRDPLLGHREQLYAMVLKDREGFSR